MKLNRRTILSLATAIMVGAAAPATAQDWPNGPVTLIVPWSAGGGTDATARMIGSLLEKKLGVPVPVVNRTGGSGVIGHTAIADAAPDGQTIGVATLEIGSMHSLGLTDLTYKAYTPIGLYNSDPAAIFVRADSGYDDMPALLTALENRPGPGVQGVRISPGRREPSGAGRDAAGVRPACRTGRLGAVRRSRPRSAGPGCRRRADCHRLPAGSRGRLCPPA